MAGDSVCRSIVKALSWRVIATAVTMAVAYAVTHELAFAAAIGLADTIIKLGAYFAHERLWNRIWLGRAKPPEYTI